MFIINKIFIYNYTFFAALQVNIKPGLFSLNNFFSPEKMISYLKKKVLEKVSVSLSNI